MYVKRGTPVSPVAVGASHERGLRAGTENVASIVALGAASEIVARDLDATAARARGLRDRLWDRLAASVPGLALNGHPPSSPPWVSLPVRHDIEHAADALIRSWRRLTAG